MVIASPTGRPARLLPYMASGAALGVAVREVMASVWPLPNQRWVSLLLSAAVASFILGWTLVGKVRPRLQAVLCGWSGALSSISVITTFALSVTPIWGLSCFAVIPLSAGTGVFVGAVVGIRRRRRREPTGETMA